MFSPATCLLLPAWQYLCTRRCWSITFPLSRALWLGRLLFYMVFISSKAVKREGCRSCYTPSDADSPGSCSIQRSTLCASGVFPFWSRHHRSFSQAISPTHHSQTKMIQQDLLAALLDKGKAMGSCDSGTEWELLALS